MSAPRRGNYGLDEPGGNRAAGLLDGHRATSHWSRLKNLQRSRPQVDRLIVPGAHSLDQAGPQLAGWAAGRGLRVELPQADGEFSFDAMLRDLAAHADRATARVTAKSIEYPTGHLHLAGPAWPWRPTTLLAVTVAAAVGAGVLPATAAHRNRP